MRKLRLLVAALCVVAGAVAATAGTARAATIVVNPGQSIQAAIDAANPGDTIVVRPGIYRETLLIQKDRIKLQGSLATISPPPASTSPCGDVGVCVVGNIDFNTFDIFGYVHNVTVTGFTIQGFADFGIMAYAAINSTFTNDHASGNGEYGITAFASQSTTIANDVTDGSGEAGIYIGDSPDSRANVHDNFSQHNAFGVLYRNATGGSIQHNTITHNCAGIVVLGDAPGPAGTVSIQSNQVTSNSTGLRQRRHGSGLGRRHRARRGLLCRRPREQRPVQHSVGLHVPPGRHRGRLGLCRDAVEPQHRQRQHGSAQRAGPVLGRARPRQRLHEQRLQDEHSGRALPLIEADR